MSANKETRQPILTGTLLAAQVNLVNGHQLAELRALLDVCVTAKNQHHASLFDENGNELRSQLGPENDGGTTVAFDTTIIGILNRIDKTLEESWRWGPQLEALALAKEEVVAAQNLVVEQVKAAKHYGRPAVRFGAITTTHPGGGYVTFLRLSNAPGVGIIQGVGATVEESLDMFDRVFTATAVTEADTNLQVGAQEKTAVETKPTPTKGPPPKKPRTSRKGGVK